MCGQAKAAWPEHSSALDSISQAAAAADDDDDDVDDDDDASTRK